MASTKTKLEFDYVSLAKAVFVVVAVLFFMSFLYKIRSALSLLVVAGFLALALNPPVSYIAKKIPGGSRALATGIAYLIVVITLGAFAYSTVPPLVRETRNLVTTIPERVDDFKRSSQGGAVADFIERYNIDDEANELVESITSNLGGSGGTVLRSVGTVTGGIVSILTVLVITFLMLVEGPIWMDLLWAYTPEKQRERNKQLASQMYKVVTGYVNGQLLVALIAGISSLVMMLIVGLPNPIALAGLVTIFGLLPLIGATLGSVLITIIAAFQSVQIAIVMLLFFIIYQQVENNIIQPYVQSRTLDMSPLLIFVAAILGFNAAGLLGGFIAIPVAGAIREVIKDIAVRRNMGAQNGTKSAAKAKKPA
jgi:predicted PurR-regulated permease PerM